jgi:hypothetical protein
LGRAVELGYTNATTLRDWLGAWSNGIVADAVNPNMCTDYQMTPGPSSGVTFYQTWSDVYNSANTPEENKDKTAVTDPGINGNTTFPGNAEHNYGLIAMCAQTYAAHLTDGAEVREFYEDEILALATDMNYNPKWAILPRS